MGGWGLLSVKGKDPKDCKEKAYKMIKKDLKRFMKQENPYALYLQLLHEVITNEDFIDRISHFSFKPIGSKGTIHD